MKTHTRAFSLIEVILSVAMLSIVAFGVFSAWLYGDELLSFL
jgi:prepilin-type N-terminal cleavage/methylation domain-containing protein